MESSVRTSAIRPLDFLQQDGYMSRDSVWRAKLLHVVSSATRR